MRYAGGFGNDNYIVANPVLVSALDFFVLHSRHRIRVSLDRERQHPFGIGHGIDFLVALAFPDGFGEGSVRIGGGGWFGRHRDYKRRQTILHRSRKKGAACRRRYLNQPISSK